MGKVVTIGRWPLYGGQNEWSKALLGLTKVAFIERWPYYRVATIRRFHCIPVAFGDDFAGVHICSIVGSAAVSVCEVIDFMGTQFRKSTLPVVFPVSLSTVTIC